MADRSGLDFPFGHFGHNEYDIRSRTWRLGREMTPHLVLRPLGAPKVSHHPQNALQGSSDSDARHNRPKTRHDKEIEALVRSYPEIRSVSNILHPFLRTSEVAQDAECRYDPIRSCSMTFGHVYSKHHHQHLPVLCMVTGVTRCSLRLVRVRMQKRGWNDSRTSSIAVPVLRGEETMWTSEHEPIQQIRFSKLTDYANTLLAVRQLTTTLIFRPLHRKVSPESLWSSQISFNEPYKVPVEETGGFGHADVAFNPWFPQQVAIIDQAGQWQVIEFQSRNVKRVARTWKAAAPMVDAARLTVLYDGWSRIAWVTNTLTLAVCTRRSLTLFNIGGEDPVIVASINSEDQGSFPSFIDIIVIPGHSDLLCVLTNTHLTVYRVLWDVSGGTSVQTITRIRHFKNPEDLGMRLYCWAEDEYATLIVYSSSNDILSTYNLNITHANPVLCGDPTNLDIRGSLISSMSSTSIIDLYIHPLEIKIDDDRAHITLRQYVDHGLRFYSMAVLLDDTTLLETLLYGTTNDQPQIDLVAPQWERKTYATSLRIEHERFVVRDEAVEIEEDRLARTEPIPRYARRPVRSNRARNRSLDFEQSTADLDGRNLQTRSLEEILTEISNMAVNPPVPMALNAFAQTEIFVEDIEGASLLLEQINIERLDVPATLTDDEAQLEHIPMAVTSVSLPPFAGFSEGERMCNLPSIYHSMVTTWITPLSENVSGRVRLAKSRLARSVAAEIILAEKFWIAKQPSDSQETQRTKDKVQPAGLTWDLPMRASQNLSQDLPVAQSLKAPTLPSSLPTPSPTATPSVNTTSRFTSSFAAPEINRLSQYTTFNNPSPIPPLPRSLRNVLSHWNVGDDPATYDWRSATRQKNRLNELEDEDEETHEMSEKERERMRRRAERHIQRQRKEAAASQAQQLASSQVPVVLSNSQPALIQPARQSQGAIPGSSQSVDPNRLVASQVLQGRYGGRPPPKKKRKSGF